MPKYLVTFKAVNSRISVNSEARRKQQIPFTEFVQQALKSGAMKDWGVAPDSMKGYAVIEGSESDLSSMEQMLIPYFKFEEQVVLTADEFLKVLKKA